MRRLDAARLKEAARLEAKRLDAARLEAEKAVQLPLGSWPPLMRVDEDPENAHKHLQDSALRKGFRLKLQRTRLSS